MTIEFGAKAKVEPSKRRDRWRLSKSAPVQGIDLSGPNRATSATRHSISGLSSPN